MAYQEALDAATTAENKVKKTMVRIFIWNLYSSDGRANYKNLF